MSAHRTTAALANRRRPGNVASAWCAGARGRTTLTSPAAHVASASPPTRGAPASGSGSRVDSAGRMPGQRTRHPLSWDRDRRVLIGLVLFAVGATVLALWGLVLLGQRDPIFAGRLGLRFLRFAVFRLPLALAEELPWQI